MPCISFNRNPWFERTSRNFWIQVAQNSTNAIKTFVEFCKRKHVYMEDWYKATLLKLNGFLLEWKDIKEKVKNKPYNYSKGSFTLIIVLIKIIDKSSKDIAACGQSINNKFIIECSHNKNIQIINFSSLLAMISDNGQWLFIIDIFTIW